MENDNKSANPTESSAMWVDPDAKATGILLSDRIELYVREVRLIDPFQEKNLCPASYDLTLGADCWYSEHASTTGGQMRMLKSGEQLIVAPNSIVFVSSAETLNLPFYLVARFDLKLRFLHEGLLIGTGPQVDPGFRGRLSCPIHNISSEKICLTCGETFAVVEFQKTTPFAQGEHLTGQSSIAHIRNLGESKKLKGVHSFSCYTFPSRALDRPPIKGYLPTGKNVSSSVQGVVDKLAQHREEVDGQLAVIDKWQGRINVGAFIALMGVAISLGTYFYATINWHKNAYDSAIRAEEQTKQIKSELDKLQLEYDKLAHQYVAPTNLPIAQTAALTNGAANAKP